MNDFILLKALVAKEIDIKDLLLDPNNPRFSRMKKDIPVKNIDKESTQSNTLSYINSFGIKELKESIQNTGFLPIDRIVVVQLKEGSKKYVVLEGNRRVSAIKSLLLDIAEGIEVRQDVKDSLEKIPVVVLKDMTYGDSNDYKFLIQGIRHISGVKSWNPYEQAKALVALIDDLGYFFVDAAKTLGLGKNKASWMRKAYYAFEVMRNDEEVTVDTNEPEITKYFSYFVELIKNTYLRSYYGWNDEENRFENHRELINFYEWIGLKDLENGEEHPVQIPMAIDVRKLPKVLENEKSNLILSSGENIHKAIATLNIISEEEKEDYSVQLKDILNKLKRLPSNFVKNMSDEDIKNLESIIKISQEHLE